VHERQLRVQRFVHRETGQFIVAIDLIAVQLGVVDHAVGHSRLSGRRDE
jgi:hypothetical protein